MIQALSGADFRTVRRYITALRDALGASVRKKHLLGELKLGVGRVVEVDETFLCHRKYNVGRKTVMEGTWVLGLTEVDAASHPIENAEALAKLREREEKREQAARERAEMRKRVRERRILSRLSAFPSAFSRSSVQANQTSQHARHQPSRLDVNLPDDVSEEDEV